MLCARHTAVLSLLAVLGCSVLRSTPDRDGNHVIAMYSLPQVKVRLQVVDATVQDEAGDTSHKLLLKYAGTVTEPDPEQPYALRYDESWFSGDEVNVELNDKGLLQHVKVTTAERTADLIIQLAKGVSSIKPAGVVAEFEVAVLEFDPSDEASVASLEGKLKELETAFITKSDRPVESGREEPRLLSVEVTEPPAISIPAADPAPTAPQLAEEFDGIVYRPALPYTLTLTDELRTATQTVCIPNAAPILAVDVRRAAFVTTVTELTFADGVLTKVSINKPSQAIAFASIPIEIAKAIVSVPAELIQIKINENDKEKALLQSEKDLLQAEKELREYQEKLKEDEL